MLVVQHRLAKQLDLLDLIVRWSRQAFQRLRFDPIDLSFYCAISRSAAGERDTDASCANAEPKLSAMTIASAAQGMCRCVIVESMIGQS
jgi:hypothetical protein